MEHEPKRSPVPETIKMQPDGESAVTRMLKEAGTCILCGHCHGKKDGEDLHCRRFPPTVYYNQLGNVAETKYPGVSTDFSCGEFKDQ